MLSKEDNELLCRVGPGTPMGNLMRQYWLPAIRSDELPAPDCPPLRVKLLGEELIGFRMTSGRVGLVQNACPHRGASLYYGRNEDEGLRCVYHGWKFDGEGRCVDMPSEPAESNFKGKVRTAAYKTYERNGIIWAYMGPREAPPPLPELEALLMNTGPETISIIHRPCNWMQGWEGEMDTVHAAFLHFGAARVEEMKPGSFDYYHYLQRSARFATIDTDFGVASGAYRPAGEDSYYWRVTQILFPFYNMLPAGNLGEGIRIGAYVPMDDEHHLHWEVFGRAGAPGGSASPPAPAAPTPPPTPRPGRLPNTADWYGRFNIEQTLANDYLIDREAQSSGRSFTGIPGVRQQDMAVTESMGPIYQRHKEHLGTTDQFIIRVRRKLIAEAKALRDQGKVPDRVDHPEVYRQRSGEMIIPRSEDWWTYYTALREKFNADAQPAAGALA